MVHGRGFYHVYLLNWRIIIYIILWRHRSTVSFLTVDSNSSNPTVSIQLLKCWTFLYRVVGNRKITSSVPINYKQTINPTAEFQCMLFIIQYPICYLWNDRIIFGKGNWWMVNLFAVILRINQSMILEYIAAFHDFACLTCIYVWTMRSGNLEENPYRIYFINWHTLCS